MHLDDAGGLRTKLLNGLRTKLKNNIKAVDWFEHMQSETVQYKGTPIKFDVEALAAEGMAGEQLRRETLHLWSQWGMFSGDRWQDFVNHAVSGMRPRIKKGDSVFETGCGVGAALHSLVQSHGGLKVAGVDLSPFQTSVAAAVLSKHQAYPNAFAVADGRELPRRFLSEPFDHVISLGVVCYLDSLSDVRSLLREMLAVTKPGGSLALSMLPPDRLSLNSCTVMIPKQFWEDLQVAMGFTVTGFSMQKDWTDTYDGPPEAQSGGNRPGKFPHFNR